MKRDSIYIKLQSGTHVDTVQYLTGEYLWLALWLSWHVILVEVDRNFASKTSVKIVCHQRCTLINQLHRGFSPRGFSQYRHIDLSAFLAGPLAWSMHGCSPLKLTRGVVEFQESERCCTPAR